MSKKRPEHDPHHVALVAASLLQGYGPKQEPHNIQYAVKSAREILDEAHGWKDEPDGEVELADEPAPEPAPEPEPAPAPKPAKGSKAKA